MLTREQMYKRFDEVISQTVIKSDPEHVSSQDSEIIGRYCRIVHMGGQPEDDIFDLWLCNPEKMEVGLRQKRIESIVNAMQGSTSDDLMFNVLDGEAFTQRATKQLVLDNLEVLGIRKKRKATPGSFSIPVGTNNIPPTERLGDSQPRLQSISST